MSYYMTYSISYDGDAENVMKDIRAALGSDAIRNMKTDVRFSEVGHSVGKPSTVIRLSVYTHHYVLEDAPPWNPAVYEGADPLKEPLENEVEGFVSLRQSTMA